MVLVGINEELTSRGVVLSRLREAYRPVWAVTFTGALFRLQHLLLTAASDPVEDPKLVSVRVRTAAAGLTYILTVSFQATATQRSERHPCRLAGVAPCRPGGACLPVERGLADTAGRGSFRRP